MKSNLIIFFNLICNIPSGNLNAQSSEWNLDFEYWDFDDTTPDLWHDKLDPKNYGKRIEV